MFLCTPSYCAHRIMLSQCFFLILFPQINSASLTQVSPMLKQTAKRPNNTLLYLRQYSHAKQSLFYYLNCFLTKGRPSHIKQSKEQKNLSLIICVSQKNHHVIYCFTIFFKDLNSPFKTFFVSAMVTIPPPLMHPLSGWGL